LPLVALSPRDRERVVELLRSAFGIGQTAPFLTPALLDWKYHQPRPDWPGSRSYAWMAGEEIAAHACICPITYRLPEGREITGSHFIDWAAGRRAVGAGGLLVRKLASMFDVLLAIGGSDDTQQVLPRLGFQAAGKIEFFVRVMRPWRQFRTDPFPRGWKAGPRLARNWLWSLMRMPDAPQSWTCSPVAAFDSRHQALLEAPVPFPASRRTPALMNYWLRCPGAAISAYVVSDKSGPKGWFLLSRIAGVMRIADLRVVSAEAADWEAAFALATRTAYQDPLGCELAAAATMPLAAEAIRRNGFHLPKTDPVFVLDPKGVLLRQMPIEITMMESDAAYLYTPGYPYLS
jgi:hypothetical protein